MQINSLGYKYRLEWVITGQLRGKWLSNLTSASLSSNLNIPGHAWALNAGKLFVQKGYAVILN